MKTKVGIYRDKRKTLPWVVRWYGHIDCDTGKRRRYCKSFKLKSEAERVARETAAEFDSGFARDKSRGDTLESFLNDWLRSKRNDLRIASYDLYKNTVRRLIEYFGRDAYLSDISPQQAATFISDQKNIQTHREGESLSDWSRDQIKRHTRTIFKSAVTWRLIQASPFDAVKRKKCPRRRWHYLKPTEYHQLLDVSPSLRWRAFYSLSYTSGLRSGEMFSLTWQDIDFNRGRIIITDRPGSPTMPPFHVKDFEKREIPIPPHTVALLVRLQSEAPEAVPFVFMTRERYERVLSRWQAIHKAGKPWKNRFLINNLNRDFKRYVKRAGIRPVGSLTIHTLRKACIMNWANNLPIFVTKEYAGHSNIATTQEYYTLVDPDHDAKAQRIIQELLEPQESQQSAESDARVTPVPFLG